MYQVVNLSFKERVKMYMNTSKEELAHMLAQRDMLEEAKELVSYPYTSTNDFSLESSDEVAELGKTTIDEAILKRAIKEYELASKQGNERIMQVLEAIFTDELDKVKSITSRIKTFEDACKMLDSNHPYMRAYCNNTAEFLKPFLKLCIITEALNEGWKPSGNDRNCYFPKFYIYPEGDDTPYTYVIPDSGEHVLYSTVGKITLGFDTTFPMQLVYKSKELAEYSGRQFTPLWAKYLYMYEQAISVNKTG